MRPGACRLGAIARPPDVEPRDHTQARRMFNRLMGRAIFAHTNGIVGKNVDDSDFHQRGHPDGIPAVITKRQKGPAVRNESAVQSDSIERGCHAKFTHPVVHITAPGLAATDRAAPGEIRQV